jgi:hypothetical protein
MREYRRRRVTPYSAATPMRHAGYDAVGASPALPLLPDTHGIAFVAPPWICRAPTAGGSGARNATRQGSSATCFSSVAGGLLASRGAVDTDSGR